MANESTWEWFPDPAYFDMYCVRKTTDRKFGQGFHLVNRDEANGLCDLLNAQERAEARVRELEAVIGRLISLVRGYAPRGQEFGADQVESAIAQALQP